MKRKRYSEVKIISILKEHEAELDKAAMKEIIKGKW